MYIHELTNSEYPSYYSEWMAALSSEYNLVQALEIACHDWIHFVQNLPWDRMDYRYQAGKWTIKEITQHLIDCERVFTYRAMAFARKEQGSLPMFDQDAYGANANAESRHLQELLQEFSLVRHSTIALFKSFSPEVLQQVGQIGEHTLSVRGIGFMLLAHQQQHQRVYQTRYIDAYQGDAFRID